VLFSAITGWRHGKLHDGRPLIELEHPPHATIDRVPARRFLLFTWGNAEGPVARTKTTYGFGRVTNPVFVAITAELDRRKVRRIRPSPSVRLGLAPRGCERGEGLCERTDEAGSQGGSGSGCGAPPTSSIEDGSRGRSAS
jgi:hypothetical protein